MIRLQGKQVGLSVIGLVITLGIVGYGAFVGIQYAPQVIEAQTVRSILDTIAQDHKNTPVESSADIKRSWDNFLNINDMNDLKDKAEIDGYRGKYTIKVKWERKLDLLFETKVITYEKSVTLD